MMEESKVLNHDIKTDISGIAGSREAIEALHESEEFYRALFEYTPADTIVVDYEGKVVLFNRAKRESGDRVPHVGDVMYKDYGGAHEIDMRSELMRCIKAGKTKNFPELKYGSKFLSVMISPFPKGAIIISTDITQRVRMREALKKEHAEAIAARKERSAVAKTEWKKTKELAKAYEERRSNKDEMIRTEKLAFTGRIAASIAHEIRNPLTNVSMSIGQLKKAVKPVNHRAEYFRIIEKNIERVNYLITELINCARPPKLNIRPHDVHKVLVHVLESTKNKIKAQRIKVVKKFTPESSMIKIDKELMARAFLNLVLNAVESMPTEGKLIIVTEVRENSFVVKIQDTGKGIPEEDIIKIFDPFFSSKRTGVGLGLTLCYGIITSHSGSIEVESKLRKGSIFIVSLPTEQKLRKRIIRFLTHSGASGGG